MKEPNPWLESFIQLPRSIRITIGLIALPALCLLAMTVFRELLVSNSKPFQDTSGLIIVYVLATLGPILCLSVPRIKFLHWLPAAFTGCAQFVILTLAKPPDEWWLFFTVAPFTVGAPALSLILFKRWYAPRFDI